MTMEETISQTFPGRIYLLGPSANPFWNVPRALKSLCGEIEAAQILIRAWEPLLNHRITGNNEALTEVGIATTCVVTTSLVAERAIKTLIAQAKPQEKPWGPKDRRKGQKGQDGHNLKVLFSQRLDPLDQNAVQRRLEALPDFWSRYAEVDTVGNILDIASDNFVDWRYAAEPGGVTGGVPKPLLKVAVALTLEGIGRLTLWQAANQVAAPSIREQETRW